MNTQRLINVVLLNWSSDKILIEDELEKLIASDGDMGIIANKIKELVSRLVVIETNIERFNALFSTENNEKTNGKKTDGKN